MHTYRRVIPRDLFNEGNLLKCYGQIYLNLERMRADCDAELVEDGSLEDGQPFHVTQDLDGNLTVLNVYLRVRGVRMPLRRPLNARSPYPLHMLYQNAEGDEDEIAVFEDDGKFTAEMLAFLQEGRANA